MKKKIFRLLPLLFIVGVFFFIKLRDSKTIEDSQLKEINSESNKGILTKEIDSSLGSLKFKLPVTSKKNEKTIDLSQKKVRVLFKNNKKLIIDNKIWIQGTARSTQELEKKYNIKKTRYGEYIEFNDKNITDIINDLDKKKIKYNFNEIKKSPRLL